MFWPLDGHVNGSPVVNSKMPLIGESQTAPCQSQITPLNSSQENVSTRLDGCDRSRAKIDEKSTRTFFSDHFGHF